MNLVEVFENFSAKAGKLRGDCDELVGMVETAPPRMLVEVLLHIGLSGEDTLKLASNSRESATALRDLANTLDRLHCAFEGRMREIVNMHNELNQVPFPAPQPEKDK